ncbi:MAG: hypothetical protein Q9217_002266 [Psora testacea]
MAADSLDFFASDTFHTYTTTFPFKSRRQSSLIPGATRHSAIYSTSTTVLHDTLISFLSYIKTYNIPILPVTKPDIRSVLGEGASFLVNGAVVPRDYVDPSSGKVFPQGTVVALKRAKLLEDMDPIADRIRVIFNELLTMNHAPLAAHPNIVNLLGIGFETEGPSESQNAMPILIPECAELGNLAEILETARKEGRPLDFGDKISLCLDIAHGLDILHACDIVHGDVKCENILIFDKDDHDGPTGPENFSLYSKLTDFGVSRLPSGELVLGGSRPWQAPECFRGAYLKIEEAKRTDIYSFGMLLWRVCLDGDPFKSLGEFEGETAKERRQKRNDAITKLKDEDRLVQHVCNSLALSERFSRSQLEMLCEVISITLLKEAGRRELDIRRIIRLLTPDNWFQARHPVPPSRLPLNVHTNLLDMEKWHSEFEGVSPVVQSCIVKGFRDYALSPPDHLQLDHEEKRSAAAYQLAVCCANGFGGKFHPKECAKWLTFAAERGSQKAQDALDKLLQAFPPESVPFKNPWSTGEDGDSVLSSSWGSEFPAVSAKHPVVGDSNLPSDSEVTCLGAAETCNYRAINNLLECGVKPGISIDGVSPLHFLSSWDASKTEDLGRRLVNAGANINAVAVRGPTVGGTPLMWSVYGNHIQHSLVLLKLGADPLTMTSEGEDSLSFAARLHLAAHLRLLLEHTRPAHVRGHLRRLIEAAAGGESRFTRIHRHGGKWQTAAIDTFQLLHDWNTLFPDAADFRTLAIPALVGGLKSPYGRMSTDAQVGLIKNTSIDASQLHELLRESVLSYNTDLFDALLDYGVPITCTFEREKTLLHLCAQIPDHSLASTAFAPRLLSLGAELDSRDRNGITPWMDAVLERKWDLADLLMKEGADALAIDTEGFNIMGLCIKAVNLGSIKYLLKYSAQKEKFQRHSFLVNRKKPISALQLAAALTLPRAHGMKIEVIGTFLTISANFALEPSHLNFRSNGLLPDATALDIAASKGNVYAVKTLVKKGASPPDSKRISGWAQAKLSTTDDYLEKKNLERCIYIIENWHRDKRETQRLADDWTNLRTIDESHVNSSWEIVVFDYKSRKGGDKSLRTEVKIAELISQILSNVPSDQSHVYKTWLIKVASWFIPAVVGISLVVFAIWTAVAFKVRKENAGGSIGLAVKYHITVLAVSCPCALGLAVPMVLIIAGGVAAKSGIVIKQASATERAYRTTDVFFDKTGTLTTGTLKVIEEAYYDTFLQAADVKSLVCTLLQDNNHTVYSAVASHLQNLVDAAVRLGDIQSVPGAGLKATGIRKWGESGQSLLARRRCSSRKQPTHRTWYD